MTSAWERMAERVSENAAIEPLVVEPLVVEKKNRVWSRRMTSDKIKSLQAIKSVAPEEDSNVGWKPLSLSTPILSAVIALTLLLAAAIETLAQRSAAQGGLAMSPSLEEIPTYARLSYLYVPTTIAVLYSIIWSWIDLDAKRMQPWFELSKPEGATGENSLFMDYQYDFVATVPFKSARKKHWPVFFAGTAMVMVFWLLTPLQSALMGLDTVAHTKSATISTRSQLRPLIEQEALLNPDILNTGYAIGWLNQPYAPFTTSEYALLPFYLEDDPAPKTVATNWTAQTTKLSTELSCWPAEMEQSGPRGRSSFNFLNGQGCNATVSFNPNANYSMLYIGYSSSAYSDFFLAGPNCPKTENSTHQFLALWATPVPVSGSTSPDFNITALYCQPLYYKQKVLATVESSSLEPINDSIQALSPRELLTATEFNTTAFEYLLANGMPQDLIVKDFPSNNVVEQTPRLNGTGLTRPVSNMVGFALAGRELPTTDYSFPDTLAGVYFDAHQHLFSVAVNGLLTNTTQVSNRTVSVEFALHGVVVSRVFATTVECLLGVVAVFTALVLWFTRNALSNLPMNPSTLGRHVDIFRDSPELLQAFRPMDKADEKLLLEEFRNDEFRLSYDRYSQNTRATIYKAQTNLYTSIERAQTLQNSDYEPVKPWVLRRWTGSIFVVVLMTGIGGLTFLKLQEKKLNGLYRPSENFEVLQLLENYIPTIFATLIEPVWVLLNRMLCVLQPFKSLWEGKATSSISMDATYTSIPPQLTLFRALKSRHFTLALVCTMALLANVLAVGLGSLFNEAPMTATYAEVLQPAFAPRFDNSSVYSFGSFLFQNLVASSGYQDHMYVAMANMSSGTTLPPWVSTEYFFQRYELPNASPNALGDAYSLTTRGFGVNANCTPTSAFALPVNLTASVTPPGNKTCGSLIDTAGVEIRENTSNRSLGASAFEYAKTLTINNRPDHCDVPLTLGWGRSAKAEDINGTVEASFLICRPIFQTAMFNLTVDSSGYVLSYKKTSELKTTLDYADSKDHTDGMFAHLNHQFNAGAFEWHNDTLSNDWMNYLIMLSTGSRDVLDPELPAPDPKPLVPVVEDIYRRLFVILLSLNEHLFEPSGDTKSIATVRSTEETRIFMENASFIITMVVLGLNTAAAMVFYIRAVAFVLPRMPTTLGSILAYIASSRLASPTWKQTPGQAYRTFSFGKYVGVDGETHIGVEMDPYVEPVNLSSTKKEDQLHQTRGRSFFLRKPQINRRGSWI
ncbi:hypothetical protein B0J13DRAFT_673264 [Dactylonectria estremocensis]|uniref:Uncharacterized protein n=1 Tax=Dactylonectria estremocensis TaxID=1079267 RepID=A0A9P9J7E5_9HYPO|nr:hypothetical protein B0J13DRAFT_673264 [Dactylonectria estremocensis]